MKKIRPVSLLMLFILLCGASYGQEWARMMEDPHGNYYTIKAEFEKYWLTHDKDVPGSGYKRFKRWEEYVAPMVYPSGDLSLLGQTAKEYEKYIKQQAADRSQQVMSTTWMPIGPMGTQYPGGGLPELNAGRLNFITIDPTNTLNLWVGAPCGGLWKSTDGGQSWSTNTNLLPTPGCSDLAIDPTNTNILYLATGDRAGEMISNGVYKSIDGGQTWNSSGLVPAVGTYFVISKLLINPSNPQVLLAATNNGIYRTTNGGTSWTQVGTGYTSDLEFKPGDPNTVYASGQDVRRSANGGASFVQITNGITNSASRIVLAVTPDDPNYVYAFAATSNGSGFMGLYCSTNSGLSFSLISSNTPNIVGGNGGYNLAVAASPLNKNEVVAGGINLFQSLDGGITWSPYNQYSPPPTIHVDNHELEYAPDGTLFNGNDGSLYRRSVNSPTWTQISGSMNISQVYRIGLSALTPNKLISGHQDNGTSIWNGSSYEKKIAGDGLACFFDRTNDNTVFGSTQQGGLARSFNGGASFSYIITGLTGTAGWLTPWKQDPVVANTLYAGLTDLFVSTNQGSSWTQLTPLPAQWPIQEFAIAESNNQVIYVVKSTAVFRTANAGASWTNITGTLPLNTAFAMNICVSPTDANKAWIVFAGSSAGNKVYMTTNGGASWTNYSANLPNVGVASCVYEPGSNDRVYVGSDLGVFYRDNSLASWVPYSNALPNVRVRDLEISPASPTLLYAATYGRGVWVTNLVSASLTPMSAFSAPAGTLCTGAQLTFTDQSSDTPTSWSWSITPNTGVSLNSSSSQNPGISFASPGTYTVSMKAVNSSGTGSVYSKTVSIAPSPSLSISVSSPTVCIGDVVTLTVSGANSYTWSDFGGSNPTASYNVYGFSQYTVSGSSNGCSSETVVSVDASLCTGISRIQLGGDSYFVFPNPSKGKLSIRSSSSSGETIDLRIIDVAGKLVFSQQLVFQATIKTAEVNMEGLLPGAYFVILSTGQQQSTAMRIIKE